MRTDPFAPRTPSGATSTLYPPVFSPTSTPGPGPKSAKAKGFVAINQSITRGPIKAVFLWHWVAEETGPLTQTGRWGRERYGAVPISAGCRFDRPEGDWDLIEGELMTFADPARDLLPSDRLEGFRLTGSERTSRR